jgi:UDPglucose--hexose-1-phosphate uridylyltransferase
MEAAQKHFEEQGTCIYCRIIEYETQARKRIIYENEKFVVLAPFASRIPFELRVYPKTHQYSFGMIDENDMPFAAAALQAALQSLRAALGDPAYNFFIHSVPSHMDAKQYHWHLEIIPKTAVWAGFEISTGMYISSLAPEDAASFLKGALEDKKQS